MVQGVGIHVHATISSEDVLLACVISVLHTYHVRHRQNVFMQSECNSLNFGSSVNILTIKLKDDNILEGKTTSFFKKLKFLKVKDYLKMLKLSVFLNDIMNVLSEIL